MRVKGREFRWGERTYIMGVLNVTPDSFSGDGLGGDLEAAVSQARRLVDEGADILDIGGESTRPDASRLSTEEELKRVIPVVERLAGLRVPLSVDTYKAEVARRALDAGADIINDVWGLKMDPGLAKLAADKKAPLVITSNQRDRGDGRVPDIVKSVLADLKRSTGAALEAGVASENIIIDPGFGFGKTLEQNLELLRRLDELNGLGYPILVGTSRKSMIGLLLGLPPDQRLEGTAATVAIGIARGADIVRVHDVLYMARVCKMSDAIIRRKAGG
ncbi:MAG: dihydropteroate synthase [Dehalococcoidia bacterium]|nr:dihydropteroate synthase [Dehalococcoidia bacterium]